MKSKFNQKAPNWPQDPQAAKLLERHIEFGELGELSLQALPPRPLYLVTYMNSQTGGRIRSATVVSVTNQSRFVNRVAVSFFRGFSDNSSPLGVCFFSIPPDFTVDFGSRDLPNEITVINSTPATKLTFDEGRAIVSAYHPEIAVSARVIYTAGDDDQSLLAITDCKVVKFGEGNIGD